MRGVAAGLALLLAGCAASPWPGPLASDAALSGAPVDPVEDRLRTMVTTLASAEFGGRRPGTPGETRTLRYLADAWRAIGLVSGTNDPGNPWFAPVDLVRFQPAFQHAVFRRRGRPVDLPGDSWFAVTPGRRALVTDAPLVFVAAGTDDRAKGATGALDAVAASDFAGRVAVLFDAGGDSKARADAVLAAGAAAVVIVTDGERDVDAVRDQYADGVGLLADRVPQGELRVFLSPSAFAAWLGAGAGGAGALHALDGTGERRALPLALTVETGSDQRRIRSHNLVGLLPGRRPQAGAVLLLAHWDHFGECGPMPEPRPICPGAVDNASGLAVLTEAARMIAAAGPRDRDIYILATTAEELGLLGAEAFAQSPPVPLGAFVAAFNIDTVAIAPRGAPVAVVGAGRTGLDRAVDGVIAAVGRTRAEDGYSQAFLKRQDGWALTRHDVPAVMVTGAYGDRALMDTYLATRYHRPEDRADAGIEYGGAAEDAALLAALARHFADTRAWPDRAAASVPPAP